MLVLYISKTEIWCGGCGKAAYAFATAHIIVPPATVHGLIVEGCGEQFTHISCMEHCDWAHEWAQEHRHDLIWIDS